MNENMTLSDYMLQHCTEIMERALSAQRYPLWKRLCPGMNDIDFTRLVLGDNYLDWFATTILTGR